MQTILDLSLQYRKTKIVLSFPKTKVNFSEKMPLVTQTLSQAVQLGKELGQICNLVKGTFGLKYWKAMWRII